MNYLYSNCMILVLLEYNLLQINDLIFSKNTFSIQWNVLDCIIK
jgi:hypothetical protein